MQSPFEAAAPPRADWKPVLDFVPRAALRLALVLAAAVPATSHSPRELPVPGLLGELRAALPAPPIAPRLSVATRHLPCPARARPGETVPRAECAPPPPSRALSAVAARAGAAVHASADPDALHVLGVVDLPWAGASGNRLDESISMLRRAARMSARPAPVLADLSAAHLVRAEARQTPRDLVDALEAAEAAAELAPGHPAALYNRALALDRLALDGQAARAWREFLMVDSHSGWAEEARARVRALEAPAPRPALAGGATTRAAAAFARLAPQEARVHGWDRLLETWGEDVLAGRAARAERTLRLVEAMGEALERRGGDASLADAVRAIRARAGDPAAIRELARAHRAYAHGIAEYDASRRDSAEVSFAMALASSGASPALARWAAVQRAGMLIALATGGRRERGERLLEAELAGIDAGRHPALAARARWVLGTAALRTGRHARALEFYRGAAALFARAGERENRGAVEAFAAETRFKAGETAGGFAMMHRALVTLRPYRDSGWLHNLLYISARATEDAGLLRSALRVQDEDVLMAAGAWPAALPEAHLVRARIYAAAGRTREALEDIRAGRRHLREVGGDPRGWLEADLRIAQARASLLSDPARSAAAMDSVLGYFRDGISLSRWLDAMMLRADARVRLGDAARAGEDLERVAAKVEQQRALADSVGNPAAFLDAARGVFDRLVMLHASAGRPAEALRHLERARASLTVVGAAPAPQRRLAAPPGQVAVEYALVGDTLLAWAVSGATVRMARDTVDRAALLLAVEKARSLEIPGAAAAAAPALRELYERLVRPVEGWLGGEGTPLVIVADGELADVPFAALHDRRRDRYLVELHPLRVAGSLRDGSGTSPARAPPAGEALLVADPAFDRAAHPDLQPLAGAAAEVEALSAVYPRARVVRGAAAGREAVEAGLGRAAVVHFAGHAVFDAERPERSFLVLAPSAGGGGGRLSAAEIERLDLGHVRLVVLSACQTLRGRTGRSGGISGLSGALLGAGAGGVVGSLWQVRDESTRALMAEFHRAYAASGDGAAALRQAQLHLLRSGDPELASPAAWAGFRYAGR